MTSRPWLIVLGWGAANAVLFSLMFAFNARLWAEMLYLCAGVPLTLFGVAIWAAGGATSQVRPLGGAAASAAPLAFGCALIGIGVIFAMWISLVGIVLVLGFGGKLLLARPGRIPVPHAQLARLPVRTLASEPTFSVEAVRAAEEAETQQDEPAGPEGQDEGDDEGAGVAAAVSRAARPAALIAGIAAGIAAWWRRRRTERQP